MYNFSISNDNIKVIVKGKVINVHEGQANFPFLRAALLDKRWDDVPKHLTAEKSLADWLSLVSPSFTVDGDNIKYLGEELPASFAAKIHEAVKRGESPAALLNFHARLQKNPSARSVQQLWAFLGQCNIPLTDDGCFLAYKKVREDYLDFYTGKVKNEVGTVVKMERNKISDDPREACHFGLHVGSLKYADKDYEGGRGRLLIVKVDPANVVSVPYDASCQKMRVCEYLVFGHYAGTALDNVRHEEQEALEDAEAEELALDEESAELQKDGVTTVTKVKADDKVSAWANFDAMSLAQLLEQPIEALRKYATYGCKLVGASKIPGGKSALCKRICKVAPRS